MHPAVKKFIQRRLAGDDAYKATLLSVWEYDRKWYWDQAWPYEQQWRLIERLYELGLPREDDDA